jgi:hypothetical protein
MQEIKKVLSETLSKNKEYFKIIQEKGKNAWVFLMAKNLDNNFYLKQKLEFPENIYSLKKNSSEEECNNWQRKYDINLDFLITICADYNILLDFLFIAKTENYKKLAMESIEKYKNFIKTKFFLFDVFEKDYVNINKAVQCWNKQNDLEIKRYCELKKTFKKVENKNLFED